MKNKVLIFIIGLLIGAIITAAGFLIYQKTHTNANQTSSEGNMQMMEKPDGEPPAKPDGENSGSMPEGETPPAKPDGENSGSMPEGETPPAKPDGSESTNSTSKKSKPSSKSNTKNTTNNTTNEGE